MLFLPPPAELPTPTEEIIGQGPALDASVPAPQAEASEESIIEPIQEPTVTHWYYPSYWLGPTPWDTGFELGLNGASGSSDSLSTRVGGFVKRKTDGGKIDASLYHNRTKSSGRETQNNALLDVRHDWLLKDSPWTLFLMNQTFYDEFQAFDLNVNVNTGLGYKIVEEDFLNCSASFGAGAARKFGGPRDEWVPEAQAGVKWEQKVSETQKFYAKCDYFPEWADFNNYRLLTDLGWEVELSRPSNVSLKFSLTDRFDSQSNGVNPHNTNYSILLLWKK